MNSEHIGDILNKILFAKPIPSDAFRKYVELMATRHPDGQIRSINLGLGAVSIGDNIKYGVRAERMIVREFEELDPLIGGKLAQEFIWIRMQPADGGVELLGPLAGIIFPAAGEDL